MPVNNLRIVVVWGMIIGSVGNDVCVTRKSCTIDSSQTSTDAIFPVRSVDVKTCKSVLGGLFFGDKTNLFYPGTQSTAKGERRFILPVSALTAIDSTITLVLL